MNLQDETQKLLLENNHYDPDIELGLLDEVCKELNINKEDLLNKLDELHLNIIDYLKLVDEYEAEGYDINDIFDDYEFDELKINTTSKNEKEYHNVHYTIKNNSNIIKKYSLFIESYNYSDLMKYKDNKENAINYLNSLGIKDKILNFAEDFISDKLEEYKKKGISQAYLLESGFDLYLDEDINKSYFYIQFRSKIYEDHLQDMYYIYPNLKIVKFL